MRLCQGENSSDAAAAPEAMSREATSRELSIRSMSSPRDEDRDQVDRLSILSPSAAPQDCVFESDRNIFKNKNLPVSVILKTY